ncbi:SIR2 family protein [Fundidesulfovibrio terrae]|uniref:SIR2 family protein n=1 Tax=Fundidesulfovibrio terrae TaxID=2922866 RepID=UPI001FAF5C39|nr:SIR2 family protein [Fundidesulfovibrio terrae]
MASPDDLSVFRGAQFSEAIAKLDDLLIQGGRIFLVGAGCSRCAGLPLITELTDSVLGSSELDDASKTILNEFKNQFGGSRSAHIEDYLSELVDMLAIVERRDERGATLNKMSLGTAEYTAKQLRSAVNKIKNVIALIVEKNIVIDTHRSFVEAVHRPVRVGKTSPGQVVDYLVLNYDTAIEDALALERVSYSDGIDGGVTGWWNPQTFERDGLAARVLKLHGSINWCELTDDPLPRRVGSCLQIKDSGDERRILIWPASTKHRETQLDPYAQLMDRARHIMRPKMGSQRVLVICGYSFGDTHINIEIDRALRESAGDLTIIAFTSEDVPTGQLKAWNEEDGIRDQVLIYSNRGFFHGEFSVEVKTDLLWWKFENLTRLLRGER